MEDEHERIRNALLWGTDDDLRSTGRAELHFVESELIEDFLEGSLAHSESVRFMANYLVTDERRELLNEIRLLKRFSSDAIVFDAEDIAQDKPESSSNLVTIAAIVGVLMLIVALSWILLRG